MFRFTTRDVLWLMVVVGLAVGWMCSGVPETERLRTENADLERRHIELAWKWAKEKGAPVSFETAEINMDVLPNGSLTIFADVEPVTLSTK